MKKRSSPGFTLVELLTVIAIILILVGMVMVTMSFTSSKAARTRALTEIHALSAACESYKTDNGNYPQDQNLTDSPNLDPNSTNGAVTSTEPGSYYCKSAFWLYACLTGDYNGDGVTDQQDGVALYTYWGISAPDHLVPTNYLPDLRDDMKGRRSMNLPITGTTAIGSNMPTPDLSGQPGPIYYLADPFGGCYGYSTVKSKNLAVSQSTGIPLTAAQQAQGNNPTFDLWCTCGTHAVDNLPQVQQSWVKNW